MICYDHAEHLQSLYLLSMIAGHFSSFHQVLNPHCTASSAGRGDVRGVGCPALLPALFSREGGEFVPYLFCRKSLVVARM